MPSGAVRLVAINANDARTYPEDSFQRMIERAAAQGYNFPSLRDESQETARAYGASHPPQVFVFDGTRRLRYTGMIDDNWNNPAAARRTICARRWTPSWRAVARQSPPRTPSAARSSGAVEIHAALCYSKGPASAAGVDTHERSTGSV